MFSKKMNLVDFIRDVPDWPQPGILFRDITPLLGNPDAFAVAVDQMSKPYKKAGVQYVAAVEARGFIFGAAIAEKLKAGFIPIRKAGKLPFKTESVTYDLEYGSDTVHVHNDALEQGDKVLLVDDLLATGGTMCAAAELIKKIGGDVVGLSFLIELEFLEGRKKLDDYDISVLIRY